MTTNVLTNMAAAAVAAIAATTVSAQHPTDRTITSRLEIYDIETGERTVLKEYDYLIEAPNWTMDGEWLVYNYGGR
ncbi:MAG: hypothetical protein LBV18_06230, partial [Alistipes sp.]|nr:hypothetical protein [Alistipes sp.]